MICAHIVMLWLALGPGLVATGRAADRVQSETALIAAARDAAKADDDRGADLQLAAQRGLAGKETPSVLLARRTASVCGLLRSEGEYGRAMALARRSLRILAGLKEASDGERARRLYWEASLEGDVLDHRARALELLQEAAALAPDDDRILATAERWARVLAEFGENPNVAQEVKQ